VSFLSITFCIISVVLRPVSSFSLPLNLLAQRLCYISVMSEALISFNISASLVALAYCTLTLCLVTLTFVPACRFRRTSLHTQATQFQFKCHFSSNSCPFHFFSFQLWHLFFINSPVLRNINNAFSSKLKNSPTYFSNTNSLILVTCRCEL
jgi:hypothetical protein